MDLNGIFSLFSCEYMKVIASKNLPVEITGSWTVVLGKRTDQAGLDLKLDNLTWLYPTETLAEFQFTYGNTRTAMPQLIK